MLPYSSLLSKTLLPLCLFFIILPVCLFGYLSTSIFFYQASFYPGKARYLLVLPDPSPSSFNNTSSSLCSSLLFLPVSLISYLFSSIFFYLASFLFWKSALRNNVARSFHVFFITTSSSVFHYYSCLSLLLITSLPQLSTTRHFYPGRALYGLVLPDPIPFSLSTPLHPLFSRSCCPVTGLRSGLDPFGVGAWGWRADAVPEVQQQHLGFEQSRLGSSPLRPGALTHSATALVTFSIHFNKYWFNKYPF